MTEGETFFASRLRKRSPLVYGLLLLVWAIVIVLQVAGHYRVKEAARTALINRSRDIATTLALVIRSQRHFGGIVSQERLDPALKELVNSGELLSVVLLNSADEVVASAGQPIDLKKSGMIRQGKLWEEKSVTLVNPVDLGASVTPKEESNRPTIILSRPNPPDANRGPQPGPPTEGGAGANPTAGSTPPIKDEPTGEPKSRENRPRPGRPFWMNEKEYKSLIEKRGLHGLVMVMSNESVRMASVYDFWLRCVIACFASVSVIGLGLAWRNLAKSSELQMYLSRASQMNTLLRDMNVAAAGLAHETRNPLNIVRGLAQMIFQEVTASEEIRQKSRQITDEVDRVTAQLNEFINYSKPREVRRAPVVLGAVTSDIVRALQSDLEDKAVQLKLDEENLTVDADEQLLRQVLFNLLINSIQAAAPGGEIQIVSRSYSSTEAQIEIRDNGPGIPEEHRSEIFKPYFTTHPKGTGLGLAVVQQIVLAHGWDIEYISNKPQGAVFRLSRLKISSKTR